MDKIDLFLRNLCIVMAIIMFMSLFFISSILGGIIQTLLFIIYIYMSLDIEYKSSIHGRKLDVI